MNAILSQFSPVWPTLKLFASQSSFDSNFVFRCPSVLLLSIRTEKEGGLANSCSLVSAFLAAASMCGGGRGEGRGSEHCVQGLPSM